MEAYGVCGLLPHEFMALTVPEYLSLREGRAWSEARRMRFLANMVAQLLGPHLKPGTYMPTLVEGMLGGNPIGDIEKMRERRLKAMKGDLWQST